MALGKNMKIDRLIPVAKVKKSVSDEKSNEEQTNTQNKVLAEDKVETKVSVSLDDFFDSLTSKETTNQEVLEVQQTEKEEIKPIENIDGYELDIDEENFKMIFKPSRRKTQKRILINLEGELTIKNCEIINTNINKVFQDFDNVELILNNIKEIDLTFIQLFQNIKSFYLPLDKFLSMNAEWSKEDKKILATCGFSDVLRVN